MRVLTALALMLLPAPVLAQNLDDPHNNIFVDHVGNGSNGAHRVGARIDNATTGRTAPKPAPSLVQPASSGVEVYKPRSLNDLAKDWAKAHPGELPNRKKPDPQ